MPLPKLVAQHHDRLWVLPIDGIGGQKSAAKSWRHAKVLEGIGAEEVRGNVFGQVGAGDGKVPLIGKESVFDNRRGANLLPLAGGQRHAVWVALSGVSAKMHHAVGVRVGV